MHIPDVRKSLILRDSIHGLLSVNSGPDPSVTIAKVEV